MSFLFFGIEKASAATYYVKNGGNDNADGLSDETAWATIPKVQATVTSGDTVYFDHEGTWASTVSGKPSVLVGKAGVTYDGQTYGTGTTKTKATFVANVNNDWDSYSIVELSQSNIVFRGFNIDGANYSVTGIYAGSHYTGNISGITIDQCELYNLGSNAGGWIYSIIVGGKGTTGYTMSDITVSNNYIHDVAHAGIDIYPSWNNMTASNKHVVDGAHIYGNTITNAGRYDTTQTNGFGIVLVNDTRNAIVENNVIYGNDSAAFAVRNTAAYDNPELIGAPTNFTFRNNLAFNNELMGFETLQLGDKPDLMTGKIYNNIFYNNGQAEIVISAGTYNNSSTFEIYNNTLYHDSFAAMGDNYSLVQLSKWGDSPVKPVVKLKNNLLYYYSQASFYDLHLCIDDGYGVITEHDNNLFNRQNGTLASNLVLIGSTRYTGNTIANWESTARTETPAVAGGTLPTSFTDNIPNTGYFSISSGDAINNGTDLGSVFTTSINGVIRPQGSGYDIGAYEYQETTTTGYAVSDVTTLISNWLKTGISSDLNVDNIVNTKDLGIMMSKWN